MASRFSAQMSGQMAGWPGGDAGHVAEAAGGQPQQGGVVLGPLVGEGHQGGRGEVRHVGHHRHEAVVGGGGHRHHLGPEIGHDRGHGGERRIGGVGPGGEDPHRTGEHVGVGALEPDQLGAGHRVAGHETGVVDGRRDRRLDRADVADQPGGGGQCGGDRLGQRADRGGDKGDLGVAIEAGPVDHAERHRLFGAALGAVLAVHDPAATAQGDRDRPADQPETDDVGPPRRAGSGAAHGRARSGRSATAPSR